jgi:hypothetical protein
MDTAGARVDVRFWNVRIFSSGFFFPSILVFIVVVIGALIVFSNWYIYIIAQNVEILEISPLLLLLWKK